MHTFSQNTALRVVTSGARTRLIMAGIVLMIHAYMPHFVLSVYEEIRQLAACASTAPRTTLVHINCDPLFRRRTLSGFMLAIIKRSTLQAKGDAFGR